jgi:hypothetical protein
VRLVGVADLRRDDRQVVVSLLAAPGIPRGHWDLKGLRDLRRPGSTGPPR